jgi:N-carbamoyl-L-amino-acid hydrolase
MNALRIDSNRLVQRLKVLGNVGSTGDGGCCRLALTDEDKAGRDLVIGWMRALGLHVTVDAVGNAVGVWQVGAGRPVMMGSHIDTVRTGGIYDGNLGVLAGLEVIETLQHAGVMPRRPLAVAFFTDEEGARFAPDMLGSLVYVGGLDLSAALDTVAIDGARLGDELQRIGYAGTAACPAAEPPHAFVELHVEQGPRLEVEGRRIGVVTGVQGISWKELTILGQSNHAGTTPMALRHDPAYAAAAIAVYLRQLAADMGGDQVCTVGKIDLFPNLINVVPAKAVLTLDVRNTDEARLQQAEARIDDFCRDLAEKEGVQLQFRTLARFAPVVFDPRVDEGIETVARDLGLSTLRMPSGAGHDAQMLARLCPAAMIFTQSHRGVSHNPAEYTDPTNLTEGCNVLLHTILRLADTDFL